MSEQLKIDDLVFQVRRSATRKTIGITVDRDASLLLVAPVTCSGSQLECAARSTQFWVYTKLAETALLAWPPRKRIYVTGEGFSYLGRSYRLRLIDCASESEAPFLQLRQGRFDLRVDAREAAGAHFMSWYAAHAQPWLERCVERWAERIGAHSSRVVVSDLGYRWGSCGHTSVLNFNWRVIQLPPRIIEYVVAHELTHLIEPHHNAAFWRLLGQAVFDHQARKEWLAMNGGHYAL